MGSQQPWKWSTSDTEVSLEPVDVLLEDGRPELALSYIINESMNPVVQRQQSLAWRGALLHLATVMPSFLTSRERGIMDTVKRRLPAAIAAYEHPLSCLAEEGSMRFALLRILRILAELSRSDKTLHEALDRYRIPYIALLTWLSGHDAVIQDTSQQAAEAASSCTVISSVFDDHRNIFPEATAKLGTEATARQLLAAFQRRMGYRHFTTTCAYAGTIVQFSGPQIAHELLRNRVLIRVLTVFWEILASESDHAVVCGEALPPALAFVAELMAFHEGLGNEASNAIFIDMVRSCDLASFCTLTTYRSAKMDGIYSTLLAEEEASLLTPTRAIIRVCKERPDLLQTHVQPSFLPALEHVRDLDQSAIRHIHKIIKIWATLTEISLPDDGREKEARTFETLSEVGHGGCTWYQCIFHWGAAEGAVKRAMFLDNSCKRAQYCSRYCQKRDWKDGGHRGRCKPAEKRG